MSITLLPDAPPNRLNAALATLSRLPRSWRLPLFDFLFSRTSRFYRTVGVRADRIGPCSVTLTLADRRRVRNHVRSIHAVALTLPAEYAAGLLVAQHLPASAVVVLQSLHMDLRRPVRGAIRATASLNEAQGSALRDQPKGQLDVPVTIEDETGAWPVSGVMRMAWLPRK